ncbi:hypothetical protein TUBRATIS_20040 [Tubulinosema ratisbonensis]|uniref:Uncharacterized protein n=1 Tax=Tubulinosema ratisbonensis TaxID=291195 RepID=A0A437AKC2_9MICR|nr:hypothetical protein TUBRATIS_20040 [Tubulinosema ratisbonensis]
MLGLLKVLMFNCTLNNVDFLDKYEKDNVRLTRNSFKNKESVTSYNEMQQNESTDFADEFNLDEFDSIEIEQGINKTNENINQPEEILLTHKNITDSYQPNQPSTSITGLNNPTFLSEQVEILNFIEKMPLNDHYEHLKSQQSECFDAYLAKLKQFAFPNLDYNSILNSFAKEYTSYTTTTYSYDIWEKEASKLFLKLNDCFPGFVSIILIKDLIKQTWNKEIRKNILCFLSLFDFKDLCFESFIKILEIIKPNNNFVYYFISLTKTLATKKIPRFSKENLKVHMNSKFNIFLELFLPEYFNLKNILIKKIDHVNSNTQRLHFLFNFLFYKKCNFFSKISILFATKNFYLSKCYNLFFTSIFVNEVIQLRSLLIYICNQIGLFEVSKILNFVSLLHLRFISYKKLTCLQKSMFWLTYGTLITCFTFDSLEEFKQTLITNFYQFSVNNTINWAQIDRAVISNHFC